MAGLAARVPAVGRSARGSGASTSSRDGRRPRAWEESAGREGRRRGHALCVAHRDADLQQSLTALRDLEAAARGEHGGIMRQERKGGRGGRAGASVSRRRRVTEEEKNLQRDFFAACVSHGKLDLALEYIAKSPPKRALYRSLIMQCARSDELAAARQVFQRYTDAGYAANEFLYSSMIAAAGRARDLPAAADLLAMAASDDVVNTVVANAALDAFGRAKEVTDVHHCLRLMREQDVPMDTETYNTLMQTAARIGRHGLVAALQRRMLRAGLAPTERTYAILFASAAKGGVPAVAGEAGAAWAFQRLEEARSLGLGVNNHVLSALLSALAKQGEGFHRARKALRAFEEAGGRPNVNVWCAMIKLCGATGQVAHAVEICETRCRHPLGAYLRSALCSCIADNWAMEFSKPALRWHNQAHKHWLTRLFAAGDDEPGSSPADAENETAACNAAIHMCAELGLVQQAFRAYVDMRRCGLKPDCLTYNSLVYACNVAGQPMRAIKMYEHMKRAGLEPDEFTYGVLIDTFANVGDPDQAMKIFILMKEKGIEHNTVHYTSLINAYSKAGTQDSVQRSFLIYKMMRLSGTPPNEVTLSCLIDACRRISDVDRAFQYFVDACKGGIIPSVATYHHLLKISHAHGRMDEALALVASMVEGHIKLRGPTLDSLVKVLSDQRHVSHALAQLTRMQEMGLSPSSEAMSHLVLACCADGYPLDAYQAYEQLKAFPEIPDTKVLPALVVALARAGRFKEMIEIYHDCQSSGEELDVEARVAFITSCSQAMIFRHVQGSFRELVASRAWAAQPRVGDRDKTLKSREMFDTLLVSSCRAGRTGFALEAFDEWRRVTWRAEKRHGAAKGAADRALLEEFLDDMRLSSVSLAFLESCCRKSKLEEETMRVFDICAEMRRMRDRNKTTREGMPSKTSHHFEEGRASMLF